MIARRSAEEFLAELEDILRRYRNESSGAVLREVGSDEAVRRLRELGFTAGQSLELLRSKKTK
jgi:Fe2+ transport system protein FeoA